MGKTPIARHTGPEHNINIKTENTFIIIIIFAIVVIVMIHTIDFSINGLSTGG